MSKKKKHHTSIKRDMFVKKNGVVKRTSLEQALNKIYNTVDLRTTCCGQTTCCKTACPSMYFSEFLSLISKVWKTSSKSQKIEMICKSVEYFFKNEFEKYQMGTLVKPCLLLSNEGKCLYYSNRPLNCKLYGLWPEDIYKERVDKFEKAYEGLLKREELPLNTQCPNVKRVDNSEPLTKEVIDDLFKKLEELDVKMGDFTKVQIDAKENYRTFHDWLLLKVFGDIWLSELTSFSKAASKNTIDAQIECLKQAIREKFAKDMPDLDL